jgi:hypothetical protein
MCVCVCACVCVCVYVYVCVFVEYDFYMHCAVYGQRCLSSLFNAYSDEYSGLRWSIIENICSFRFFFPSIKDFCFTIVVMNKRRSLFATKSGRRSNVSVYLRCTVFRVVPCTLRTKPNSLCLPCGNMCLLFPSCVFLHCLQFVM